MASTSGLSSRGSRRSLDKWFRCRSSSIFARSVAVSSSRYVPTRKIGSCWRRAGRGSLGSSHGIVGPTLRRHRAAPTSPRTPRRSQAHHQRLPRRDASEAARPRQTSTHLDTDRVSREGLRQRRRDRARTALNCRHLRHTHAARPGRAPRPASAAWSMAAQPASIPGNGAPPWPQVTVLSRPATEGSQNLPPTRKRLTRLGRTPLQDTMPATPPTGPREVRLGAVGPERY